MFGLGIQELVVIFVVALLVFGPKRLPELAKTMGKTFGQLRRAMFDIKAEVQREIGEESDHIKHDLPDWKKEFPFNQSPERNQPEDIKGLDRKGYDNSPEAATEANSSTEPAKEPGTEAPSSSKPSEETKDS